jgi:endonuclease YncB( thermonuclease family)
MIRFCELVSQNSGEYAMRPILIAALLILPLGTFCARNVHAQTQVTGIPRIVDGDTVQIGELKIRLLGIDAPETDQICLDKNEQRWACGITARDELINRFGGRSWDCRIAGKDRYGRSLGNCEVEGEDVEKWMVTNGWALSFVRYSNTYNGDEVTAKTAKAGLWAGAFFAPWDWRSRNSKTTVLGSVSVPTDAQSVLLSSVSAGAAPSAECQIKGNVNRRGECIFHLPGTRYYSAIKMDNSKKKRWFCSATEAVAAGCRLAGARRN